MRLGVCYFPEHWPSEGGNAMSLRWPTPASNTCGWRSSRGESSSPRRGTFDFEWFDGAIGSSATTACRRCCARRRRRRRSGWSTSGRRSGKEDPRRNRPRTRQPPALLFQLRRLPRGTARIVRRVTERYADSPHVAGWQTDNEFGCHETVRCYCDDCADAFRTWLADRYGDIDRLNGAWGTRSGASSTAPSTKSIRLGRPLQSITPRGCWRTHAFPAIPSSSTIASTPT